MKLFSSKRSISRQIRVSHASASQGEIYLDQYEGQGPGENVFIARGAHEILSLECFSASDRDLPGGQGLNTFNS